MSGVEGSEMESHLQTFCIEPTKRIREAISQMDHNRLGIMLVTDEQRRLVGTVTDGDVRRAILANVNLEQPISVLLARKAGTLYERPLTAPLGTDRAACINLLKQHNLLYLPLVDGDGRVGGLVTLDECLADQALQVQAVVMAGGKGSRLHPLTEHVPKPMLRVGERPVLEIILTQLRDVGIRQVKVTTHHKANQITEHFKDGSAFGMELAYVEEDQPLGTIGGLSLMDRPKDTTLVINGDILTQVDFRSMLLYHREHQADLTVAVRHYDVKVPYGVVECEGSTVRGISEKPVVGFFVNAGIYLLEPVVYQYLPNGRACDMPDLIRRLLDEHRMVVSFPIREYWLDIGQPEDYEQAQEEAGTWSAH